MPLLTRLASLWRNLLLKDRVEREFSEEIEAYLEMLVEAKVAEGVEAGEARREALIEIGGVEQVKERVREVRMGYFLETMWQDFRYGLRVLVKSPVTRARHRREHGHLQRRQWPPAQAPAIPRFRAYSGRLAHPAAGELSGHE
jgi:hypothetical protein